MKTPVQDIMRSVAARYGLTLEEMKGPSRKRRIARPRQLAMYLAREATRQSFPQLGLRFRRHHSDIIAGLRRIEKLMAADARFAAEVAAARESLSAAETADG